MKVSGEQRDLYPHVNGGIHGRIITAAVAGLLLVSLSGCTQDQSRLQTENQQLQARVAVLQSENDRLNAQLAQQTASLPLNNSNESATTNVAKDSFLQQPANAATINGNSQQSQTLADIAGLDGEQDICDLAKLGAFDDVAAGKFNPLQPMTRATYIRWAVTTNNIYFKDQPKNKVHLAQSGDATFVDVPSSHPDYKFIQGLANAGYVVGIDKTHFAPNQPITREQMIAIKAQLDEGSAIETNDGLRMFIHFSDVDQIDLAYLGAVHEDASVRTTNNISRIWGTIKTFRPKAAITRAEAAISLSKMGEASAADVLRKAAG